MSRMSQRMRCVRCRMRLDLCVCNVFPVFDLPTRIITLIHHRENWRPSNTGHLTRISLKNSLLKVRRDPVNFQETPHLLEEKYKNFILFPSATATELTQDFIAAMDRPICLIVPDGSWRQASKMIHRDPTLRKIPRVFLPAKSPSIYRLRKETREEGMATFEAIARALGFLEREEICDSLEAAFRVFTDRILWARGRLPLAEARASLSNLPYDPMQAYLGEK